jgi:hypothetical protein
VRAVEDADADMISRHDSQNVLEVIRARTRKPYVIAGFAGLEKDEIHDLVFIT